MEFILVMNKTVSGATNSDAAGTESSETPVSPWIEGICPRRKGNCSVLLVAPHGHPIIIARWISARTRNIPMYLFPRTISILGIRPFQYQKLMIALSGKDRDANPIMMSQWLRIF